MPRSPRRPVPVVLLCAFVICSALLAAPRGACAADTAPPNIVVILADDLAERKNLYAEKPEIVAGLTALMDRIVSEGRSTPGAKQANDQPFNWKRFLPGGAPPKKAANGGTARFASQVSSVIED